MKKNEPVRLAKVEEKRSGMLLKVQIVQTILIIILLIAMFILIATIIGTWENSANWYNYQL